MAKILKWILASTLVLLLLAALSLAGAVLLFDPNQHKDFINSTVTDLSGRSFAITGHITLSYYPWLGLDAKGITLGNADGFGNKPFFHAAHASLRIKTMPLLHGHYELDTLNLNGAELNLAKNAQGLTNWHDLIGGQAGQKQNSVPLASIVLGGVNIQNASIAWQDATTGQSVQITHLNLVTGELTYAAPIDLSGSMDLTLGKPELTSAVKLHGTLNYDLEREIYAFSPIDLTANLRGPDVPGGSAELAFDAAVKSNLKQDSLHISNMNLKILGTTVHGFLTAEKISSGKPAFDTKLTLTSDDLTRVFKLIDPQSAAALTHLSDPSADVKLALSADMSQGTVHLSEFDAKLLGADIQGQMSATNLQHRRPSATGKLTATGPDLPALLQVVGQLQFGLSKGLRTTSRRLAHVANKSFDIATEFDIDLKRGEVHLPHLAIRTLGITATSQLTATGMNTDNGSIRGTLALHGKRLAGLLTALEQPSLGKIVKTVEIEAAIRGDSKNITLKPFALKATLAGRQIPHSPVAMSLQAITQLNLTKQTLTIDELALQGLGLKLSSSIEASHLFGQPSYSGSLSVAPFNLRTLARTLNHRLPETTDETVLRRVALQSRFSGTPTSLKLEKLALQLDDSTLTGDLSIAKFSQPHIRFNIGVDSINADRYLPPPSDGKPVPPEMIAAASASQLPVNTARSLRMNGSLHVGSLTISNTRLTHADLTLNADRGMLRIEPITAELYAGTYQGDLAIDTTGSIPHITANTRLSGVQLAPLMQDYLQKSESPISGVGNISLERLTASGIDAAAIEHSMTGSGTFSIRDGVLRGIDVEKTLQQVEVILRSRHYDPPQSSGTTSFERLSGTLNISNGKVTNKDMLMLAAGFQVSGRGKLINLNDKSINYEMKIKVDPSTATRGAQTYDIGGYEIPIKCHGSISQPGCKPDGNAIAKAVLKKKGNETLRGFLEKKLPGLFSRQK